MAAAAAVGLCSRQGSFAPVLLPSIVLTSFPCSTTCVLLCTCKHAPPLMPPSCTASQCLESPLPPQHTLPAPLSSYNAPLHSPHTLHPTPYPPPKEFTCMTLSASYPSPTEFLLCCTACSALCERSRVELSPSTRTWAACSTYTQARAEFETHCLAQKRRWAAATVAKGYVRRGQSPGGTNWAVAHCDRVPATLGKTKVGLWLVSCCRHRPMQTHTQSQLPNFAQL